MSGEVGADCGKNKNCASNQHDHELRYITFNTILLLFIIIMDKEIIIIFYIIILCILYVKINLILTYISGAIAPPSFPSVWTGKYRKSMGLTLKRFVYYFVTTPT